MPKFHVDLGLPEVQLPKKLTLQYGPHARHAASTDQYGDLRNWLPRRLTLSCAEIIEVGLDASGVPDHLLVRFELFDAPGLDLVLALRLGGEADAAFVKTVWANRSNDRHCTLNQGRYAAV